MPRMRGSAGLSLVWVGMLLLVPGCHYEVTPRAIPVTQRGIGIAVEVVNGEAKPLRLLSNQETFFIQQLRFRASVQDLPLAVAVSWLEEHSGFSVLEWEGLRVVTREWETLAGDTPTYEEVRGYLGATWMSERFTFTLQPRGAGNEPLGDTITVTPEAYVLPRQTAMAWATGQPTRGDDGSNQGQYDALALSSSGTYGGSEDDIYQLRVVESGALDGSAKVEVTSLLGDAIAEPIAVQNGQPIELGAAGLGGAVTFSSVDEQQQLLAGDRWVVRAGRDGTLTQPEAGTRADHAAIAEIRFDTARSTAAELQLPVGTQTIDLRWSADDSRSVSIPVSFASADADYGFGATVSLSAPKNLRYYEPGETFTATVELTDGSGQRLHAADRLPTYADFLAGDSNGIQYYTASEIPAGHGFFDEARRNIMELTIAGPKQFIEQNYVDGQEPETYFSHEHAFPNTSQVARGGLRDPTIWQTPIPTTVEVTLPSDARQGTYIATLKAQRKFMGQSTYRLVDVEFQVGGPERTDYTDVAGNCAVCHTGDTALSRLRHGGKNPQVCVVCHAPRFGVVAQHLHTIHFLSPLFVMPRQDCSLCHVAPGSNTRASVAVCGSCHQGIHAGEGLVNEHEDRHVACATTCHADEAAGHVQLPPL